ncbi:MAG TPA: DUF4129 domain-containing protein [Firmicutes bacterium]|nr:DUF4129 domain-containing protein [Bacillota bacterium]
MNWNKSHLSRLGVEVLALCCYLSLYAPWFVLMAVHFKQPSFFWLYGRLAGLVLIAWAASYRLHQRLISAEEGARRQAILALTVAGLFFAALCVMLPEVRTVPSPFYLVIYLFAGFFAWICGVRIAGELHTNYRMQKQLVAGTLGYAACFALAYFLDIAPQFYLQVMPFLFFWLPVAVIVTGVLRVYELQGTEGTAHVKNWLRPLVTICAACLLGAVIFGFLGLPVFQIVLIPLKYIWQAVRFLLLVASYGVGYAFAYIIPLLARLLADRDFKIDPPQPPEFTEQEIMESRKTLLSPELWQIIQWIVLVLAVILVVRVAYYYLLQRRRSAAAKGEKEEKESFSSRQALRDWGRRQLQNLADSLKRRADALAPRRRDRTAVEIYHALLGLAARRGIVRPPATTAHAFQPNLQQACPDCRQETDNIFHAFVRELYAEEQAGAKEIDLLREHLAAIKKAL